MATIRSLTSGFDRLAYITNPADSSKEMSAIEASTDLRLRPDASGYILIESP